ncbi:hypothetical protein [Actinoallomurus sp. NPDC052274]|uniref:hypothetical protein n=1 Tax=Actinoallomurus sp. NPDC052274 TaxID=3155420 RepID=UPI003420453A
MPETSEAERASPSLRPSARGGYWRGASLLSKAALAGLLLFALVHPEWDRFADKAMGTRAIAYPLAALLVPADGRWRGPGGIAAVSAARAAMRRVRRG